MTWLLRSLLVLVWIPSQYLGWLMAALGMLAWQAGEAQSVILGALGFFVPMLLMVGGLYLSFRRPELGAKVLVIPIAVIALELAVMLLFAWGAGRR